MSLGWRIGEYLPLLAFLTFRHQRGAVWPFLSAKAIKILMRRLDSLGKKQGMVQSRFDYWLQGGIHDKYFHGWRDPNFRECFVFKWKMRNQHQRLYGFLFNPKPRTDAAFQVCILVSHARKNTENTDPAELDYVNEIRIRAEVIEAIRREYPENDLH
jgi:hypothetical protein